MINNFHMILVFILCVDMSWEVFFFTAVYKKVSFAIVFVLFCFDGCNDSYSYEIYIKGKNRRKKIIINVYRNFFLSLILGAHFSELFINKIDV